MLVANRRSAAVKNVNFIIAQNQALSDTHSWNLCFPKEISKQQYADGTNTESRYSVYVGLYTF
jgi:hypothetical protein